MRNGFDQGGAVKQASSEAREIRDRLARAGIETYVVSVIALTRTRLARGSMNLGSVHVMEARDLCTFIRGRSRGPIDVAAAVQAILPPAATPWS